MILKPYKRLGKTFANEASIDKSPKEGVFTNLFASNPSRKKTINERS